MIESADVPSDETKEVTSNPSDDVIEEAKSSSDVANNSHENIANLFVAIYPFDPTDAKELKLEVGDLIDVSKISETGWWKGCCVRTSGVGWFPSTYVKVSETVCDFLFTSELFFKPCIPPVRVGGT